VLHLQPHPSGYDDKNRRFRSQAGAYDVTAFKRAKRSVLDPQQGSLLLFIASAEDTILHKLHWSRKCGVVSEQQLKDVVGVLRVQGDALDFSYLKKWAEQLKVLDLLEKVLQNVQSDHFRPGGTVR